MRCQKRKKREKKAEKNEEAPQKKCCLGKLGYQAEPIFSVPICVTLHVCNLQVCSLQVLSPNPVRPARSIARAPARAGNSHPSIFPSLPLLPDFMTREGLVTSTPN